jgi:hypothetical protein
MQAELKMKNRACYEDLGVAFTKESPELFVKTTPSLHSKCLRSGVASSHGVAKAAQVRPITFYGMRHTCATLLLLAGEPAKLVPERLGHSKMGTTLDLTRTYCRHAASGRYEAGGAALSVENSRTIG